MDERIAKAAARTASQITKKETLKKAGVNVTFADDLMSKNDFQKAYKVLKDLGSEKNNVSKELLAYRKYVPMILQAMEQMQEINRRLSKSFERIETDSEEKSGQRWTPEEDEMLIELVTDSKWSTIEISTTLGRTVPAIKSRVSKLVGLKRISQEVAGRFIGTINGNDVEGTISGTVYTK